MRSRFTSIGTTLNPPRRSALAQASPDDKRNFALGRPAAHQHGNSGIRGIAVRVMIMRLRQRTADALDLPIELDAGRFLHPRRTVSPSSSICAAVAPPSLIRKLQCISETLRRANGKAAHAGLVDQLPGFVARRILEGRAAGAALDRLGGLAALGDLVHGGGNIGGIARPALQQRPR